MLDEKLLPHTSLACSVKQLAHSIQLVIAWPDDEFLLHIFFLPCLLVLDSLFLLYDLCLILQYDRQRMFAQYVFPQIGGAYASGIGWISCAAIDTFVERQKPR